MSIGEQRAKDLFRWEYQTFAIDKRQIQLGDSPPLLSVYMPLPPGWSAESTVYTPLSSCGLSRVNINVVVFLSLLFIVWSPDFVVVL